MSQSRGMPTAARRSNACWTCKLRRKKCDETHPACVSCASRSITCHGYDKEKPIWMDGYRLEKAELERIQSAVKENKRRQRRSQLEAQAYARRSSLPNLGGPSNAGTRGSPTTDMSASQLTYTNTSRVEPGSMKNESDDEAHRQNSLPNHDMSPATSVTPTIALANVTLIHSDADSPSTNAIPTHFRFSQHREAELLMHYLDQVFALQFRFHVPKVQTGGRGWLLWLLTENKPLYHAALSLGALHQHSLLTQAERHDTLIELNEHHSRAIQGLNIFLQNMYSASSNPGDRTRKENLEVLACSVEFISFELFRGGINVWEMHLNNIARWLSKRYKEEAWQQHVDNRATTGLSAASPHGSHGMEDTAERFLTGAVLWFDVLACASTGNAPLMKEHHASLLESGYIDLSNILGCQAWVALLISEIAQLDQDRRTRPMTAWELADRGGPIRDRLLHGVEALEDDIYQHFATLGANHIMLNPCEHTLAVTRAVTLAFAHATRVYLHTTVSGAFPSTNEIATSVQETAKALEDMKMVCDAQAARSLVWPICIAGSMAEDTALQTYFKGLITDLGEQAHDFGNSVTVLHIMEKCWAHWRDVPLEQSGRGYNWLTAMEEREQRVLLV